MSIEILPFIQKWMPDLVIVEPQELKDAYVKKLNQALQNH
jgi:predicted DNA-binding transcriptional regulator YafY